jgi:hypothetical protein
MLQLNDGRFAMPIFGFSALLTFDVLISVGTLVLLLLVAEEHIRRGRW